jgi:hypothetical protein
LPKDLSIASHSAGYRPPWSSKSGLMGVVFAITIPREAERNAFEQDAILNSVYEAYHGSISTFELSPRRFSVGVIPDLIPHAPSSTGPVLFTMAKVKLWTHPASTMSRTVPTKSAADVLLRVDRHSFRVAASLCGRINHATWVVSGPKMETARPGRPAPTRTRGSWKC